MNLTPELNFILQLLSAPSQVILDEKINWDIVYKLSIRHRIWHQIYAGLKPLHEQNPIPIYSQLARRCHKDKFHLLTLAAETARIAQVLTKHKIFHCFIKGMVLNIEIYGTLDHRTCKDIDVWVDPNYYRQVVEILSSLGYEKKLPRYELKGFQEKYYLKTRHDMEFYHPKRKIVVEPHFRLDYFGLHFFTPIKASCKSLSFLNTHLTTFDDHYHLLYLMTHGAIHAWSRLRWLYDIALYIKKEKCDLKRIMELAKQIDCEHIVEQSLLLVQNYFRLENPALNNLIASPSKRSLKLAATAKEFIQANYEFTEDYPVLHKMFFKYRFYLIRLASRGQKLNALLGDLFKIDNLFPYIRFPNKLAFMYYLLYPLWVIKIIISR